MKEDGDAKASASVLTESNTYSSSHTYMMEKLTPLTIKRRPLQREF